MRLPAVLAPLSLLLVLGFSAAAVAQSALPETPPDAKPGECFGFVYVPPLYNTREEQVLVSAASEHLKPTPARYEYVEETVTLPAGKRHKVVTPAVTETVEKTIKVAGGSRKVVVPATYRTVQETQTVETGTVLKASKRLGADDADGEAICLVDGPTAQRTINKRVVDRPASTRTVSEPAREKVVKRRKVVTPAVTELVDIPARTITRRVQKLVEPAGQQAVPVPARYQAVTHRELVSPGRTEWRRVLCDTNFTPALIQQLQLAMRDKAGYTGPVDGRLNAAVASSVRQYQEREGLPTGGLGLETLDRLGVSAVSVNP
jgi:peptidoglycan hydrolase-like protein with peptidoglycan-binding domain